MKRTLAALLAAVILTGTVCAAAADGLGDLLGGLGGLTAMLGGEESGEDALPKLDGEFGGEEIKVKVGSKSIKVHADFKEAMDRYEAFFDEYIEFMKSPDLAAYGDFTAKYLSAMTALEALEEKELSKGDTAYYTAVMLRIDKKLIGAIGK